MKLLDDDEIYEVDGSYLGPPGRFIAVMRYKAIFLALILGPMSFWLLFRVIKLPVTLMSVGLTAIVLFFAVGFLADRITAERSVLDLAKTLWHEVTATREDTKVLEAQAPDLRVVGRPPARRRWGLREQPPAADSLLGQGTHGRKRETNVESTAA